jgi:hypothetical protein
MIKGSGDWFKQLQDLRRRQPRTLFRSLIQQLSQRDAWLIQHHLKQPHRRILFKVKQGADGFMVDRLGRKIGGAKNGHPV